MSNYAKKTQEHWQSEEPRQSVQTVIVHKAKISFGEMTLLLVLALLIAAVGVKIVSNQSAIYDTNKEIQKIEGSIDEQVKINNDLEVQVSELSTYERIWKKAAELGLMLNENNVKVVQE
ncbi:cell division protein FtsL [Peribacillus saganii]|uniref:Cell division protein FtsL n=1 Tax=Peribacillus saganii TaxID=2303992 RepID=A0A372LSI2_9BACI|nr:cell division protein FtsL [Peribacillus saganii]RFU71171.1 cell division protein FtsL [Peribacillus saganii]